MWVYKEYEPNYDPALGKYCNKTLYLFAFWLITSVYIGLGVITAGLCSISVASIAFERPPPDLMWNLLQPPTLRSRAARHERTWKSLSVLRKKNSLRLWEVKRGLYLFSLQLWFPNNNLELISSCQGNKEFKPSRKFFSYLRIKTQFIP